MARYQRLEHEELTPALRALLAPDTPPAKRIAIARGVVPLGTRDLLLALFFLAGDRDKLVSREAQKSLRDLPESLTMLGLAGDANPKLLHFLACQAYDNHHIHEKVALHKNVRDETLAELAANSAHEAVIDILVRNEAALLRHPPLLHALAQNPHTPRSWVDRLTRFYEVEKGRSYRDDLPPELRAQAEAPAPVEPPPAEPSAIEPAAAEPSADEPLAADEERALEVPEERLHPCVRLEELLSADFDVDGLFADDLVVEPKTPVEDARRVPLQKRMARMTMVDKLLLAMRGNAEARRALIRNPNKIIQEAVLDNPRITLREVLEAVKERTTAQTLLDKICNNREWTRSYEVMRELVWHPKTSVRFVYHALSVLSRQDLTRLAASKNVATFTRQQARNMLNRREKAQ